MQHIFFLRGMFCFIIKMMQYCCRCCVTCASFCIKAECGRNKQKSFWSCWGKLWFDAAVMRVRFGIQKVCQSVQSAAFTLPNCFLKSHKRDLRNGTTVAKTRPDHFLFPQNTLSSFYIDFDPMKLFMMLDRGILIDNISSRPISIPILISVSISMSIVHIKSFWSLTFRFQKFLIFSNGIGFGIENIWYLVFG